MYPSDIVETYSMSSWYLITCKYGWEKSTQQFNALMYIVSIWRNNTFHYKIVKQQLSIKNWHTHCSQPQQMVSVSSKHSTCLFWPSSGIKYMILKLRIKCIYILNLGDVTNCKSDNNFYISIWIEAFFYIYCWWVFLVRKTFNKEKPQTPWAELQFHLFSTLALDG